MRRMNLGQEQNTEPQSDCDAIESRGTRGEWQYCMIQLKQRKVN